MKKIEYSQIVRRKLKQLETDLSQNFGVEVSKTQESIDYWEDDE